MVERLSTWPRARGHLANAGRSPGFSFGGSVEINWLPSSGIYIPGKIRDLSLERLLHRNETPRLRQHAGANRCSYEIEFIPRHWGGENDSQ
jgi:hypothetical protein